MAQISYGTITITDTTDLNTFIRYAKQVPLQSASDFQLTPDTYTHYIAVLSVPSNEAEPSWNSNKWEWSEFIGTNGLSVKSTRTLYYLKTNSSSVPEVNSSTSIVSTDVQNAWTSVNPTYVTNGTYWTCLEVTLSDNTTKSWSTPVQDLGLTSSNATANNALTQATNASQAVSLMGGHFIYKSTSSGSSTSAGAGVIQNIADSPANWGYNTWIGANGIQLRRGETADATLNVNGLILTNGGIIAGTKDQTGYIYLSTANHPVGTDGITINGFTPTASTEQWREVIGTQFGVTNAGTLYAKNAVISGNIAATNGFTVTSAAVNGVTLASMTGSGITVGQIGSNNFNILITDSAVNDRGPGILLRKGLTVLSVFGQVTTNNINSNGLHIYEPGSGILLGKFTGNEVEFGNPAINRFVMNSEGLTISNTLGASIGTIRLSTARGGSEATSVQIINNTYNLIDITTNRSIERDGNINTNWVISTPYVYSDSISNISNAVVTFKTYQLQNEQETLYSCTLDTPDGNILKGTVENESITMDYDTSTGIISITIPKSTYHKEQIFDESYCAELDIVGSGNIKYGNTSKITEISLSETPIGGTTFSINIPWLGENAWISCTAGTPWSQYITIDDYGIEDGDNIYLVKGTIFYNGTVFIFDLDAAFMRTTQRTVDEDGVVTEEDVDTVVSFTEKTISIDIIVKDFHAYGFYVKTATIQVNGPASKGNYLFGTTGLVEGQDITRNKQNVMTMGTGLIANNNNQLVIGQYNATDLEDTAFIIGVGTADNNRKTSFKVWKSGSVGFGNNLQDQVQLFAQTKNYYEAFLRIHDNGTGTGHNTVFKSDGGMIIGGGESPTYLYNNNIDGAGKSNENLYLTADNAILLYTNANTIDQRKRFGIYQSGWVDIQQGLTFNVNTNGTTKKPMISIYNNNIQSNGTYLNYGCMGFRAAGKVKPYFAFWTNQNNAGDIGRFYIEQGEVHTHNGTPFRSDGNLTVDKNSILKGTLKVSGATTLSSTLSVSGRTTLTTSTINGVITAGSGSYTYIDFTNNPVWNHGAANRDYFHAYKWGPLVHFIGLVQTTQSIAAGADIWNSDIRTASCTPKHGVYGVGYYSNHTIVAGLSAAGILNLRNASSSAIPAGANIYFSLTYIV